MTSSVLTASDLLIKLSEEYQSHQFHDENLEWKNDKELKIAKFSLLLNIIMNEYSKAIDDDINDKMEENEQSIFETSCADEDLLAAVSISRMKHNGDQKIVNEGMPKPFKLDEVSLDFIPDTCYIPNEFVLPKKTQNITSVLKKPNAITKMNYIDANKRKSEKLSPMPTHIEEKNISLLVTTPQTRPIHNVLVDNSSGGSSNGSPSILSRKKKKQSKHSAKLESKVSNPHSPKKNNHKVANVKTSIATKGLETSAKKPQLKQCQENDSFDEYQPYEDENAWVYANVPVRKKSEREKLKGFSCDACESYYKNVKLTDEELQNLLQKCSRHRATVAPPPTSPKEMWELDITGTPDKTQYGSPFKTRERRKLERQQNK